MKHLWHGWRRFHDGFVTTARDLRWFCIVQITSSNSRISPAVFFLKKQFKFAHMKLMCFKLQNSIRPWFRWLCRLSSVRYVFITTFICTKLQSVSTYNNCIRVSDNSKVSKIFLSTDVQCLKLIRIMISAPILLSGLRTISSSLVLRQRLRAAPAISLYVIIGCFNCLCICLLWGGSWNPASYSICSQKVNLMSSLGPWYFRTVSLYHEKSNNRHSSVQISLAGEATSHNFQKFQGANLTSCPHEHMDHNLAQMDATMFGWCHFK